MRALVRFGADVGHVAGSLSISRWYQSTPVQEVVDPEVLVVGVDGLPLRLAHPERREPVDPRTDGGEVPRVGRGHHHVRRGDRVREQLDDRGLDEPEGVVVDGRDGAGLALLDHVDVHALVADHLAEVGDHVGHRVTDHHPHVDAGPRRRGDHVEGGRAGQRRRRERRAGHGRRLGTGRDECSGEHGPETVGVAHQWLEGERGVRGQPPEQLDGRVRDGRRHRVAVDLQDGAGEPGGRAVPGRRGGVPAAPLDAEHDAGRALLGDADRADRHLDPGERVARDRAALVDHEPRLDPAAGELGDGLEGRRTAHLLVGAEAEPHVLGRGESLLQQPLDGLADRDDAALVVEGAAAPHRPVVDLGGERAGAATGPSRRRGPRRGAPSGRRAAPPTCRPSGRGGRGCRPGSAPGRRTGGGTAARARRGRRRTPRCRRWPGCGRRRSGCGPGPGAWPRHRRSRGQTRSATSSSRPRTPAFR